MPETFKDFIEGFGPGSREINCLVCLEPLHASKPTVTHQGPCLNTFCRQCFMSHVIHCAAARPIQDTQCPACRAIIVLNNDPVSRIERVGTDGAHTESFWPLLGGVGAQSINRLSPDVLLRAQTLGSYNVSFIEYDACAFLERAIICPSAQVFLDHVITRGGYLSARDPPNTPSRCRYIRYHDYVSVPFVRWLHADRDTLRSSFVRWCIREESTRRLDPEDAGLASLVWRGVISPQEEALSLPESADRFNVFRFAQNWYLVPESTPDTLTPLEEQFWGLGDCAWVQGWSQQGEELSRFFIAGGPRQPNDPPPNPFYAVRLGAVGPLPPGRDTAYILRTESLGNTLIKWPGAMWERKAVFGNQLSFEKFRADYVAASRGMPACDGRAVEALRKYFEEFYARLGVVRERPVTMEEDIIPPAVPGRMRMIVGSVAL